MTAFSGAADGRANWVAAGSAVMLAASFVVLYSVLSSQSLTANLMDGQYSAPSQAVVTQVSAVLSVVLALGGYGGLIWAMARRKAWWMRVLGTLVALTLVAYVPLAIFVCAVAFG